VEGVEAVVEVAAAAVAVAEVAEEEALEEAAEACLSIRGAGKPGPAMPSHIHKPTPCAPRQGNLQRLRRAPARRPRRSTRRCDLSNPISRLAENADLLERRPNTYRSQG
jgi:hypothetical protein